MYVDHEQPCKLPSQGCQQVGKAMSVPPAAVLGGLLIITSFVMSPAIVKVPGTNWVEPVLVWLTISMPTGSRKTILRNKSTVVYVAAFKPCTMTQNLKSAVHGTTNSVHC